MAIDFKCPNLGNCSKADQGVIIPVPKGAHAKCPECNASLVSRATSGRRSVPLMVVGVAVALLIAGGVSWFMRSGTPDQPNKTLAVGSNRDARGTQDAPRTILRFHGSNTIGSKLLPALAAAFMQQQGFSNVHRVPGGGEEESFIVGERSGTAEQIEIHAHGSATAFTDLKSGNADIGMSSRKIKSEEQKELSGTLGDLSSNAGEHVLALDGIAVIANPANPIRSLSLRQLADVFSGAVTDWSQVGGRAGPVAIYARDDKSGTYDFFNDAVLKKNGKKLAGNAQRFEDSQRLSDSVANDPAGVGFIGLNYIGSNRVIGLSDTGVEARRPSLLTVKTEDYLLSRRLYLYTPVAPANPNTRKFIEYALGATAQPLITESGVVNMDLAPISGAGSDCRGSEADPRCLSSRWRSLTAGALEIGTRISFRTGSAELDSRASRDIGRIVGVLSQPQFQNKPLLLIGFADSSGSQTVNEALSQNRADVVRRELAAEGLSFSKVIGLGAEAFRASNETAEGKEKNRRVEVWVKK